MVDYITKCVEYVVTNDNVGRTMKALNRCLQRHHVLRTMKAKMYFEKPCEMRLRKEKESQRRRKKNSRNFS